jgi:hypothetical protein
MSREPRGRRRKVALQRRDLAILEMLIIRRAETLDELHRLHFGGLSRKRALNRLGELAGAGYLHRASVTVLGSDEPQSVYTLGPRGRRALELRSLASEYLRYRRFNPTLRDSSMPHQIATNRVADWLGAHLVPEHLLPPKDAHAARNRPDGMYESAEPDHAGRTIVFLEIDMGHYSRARILGKVKAFLEEHDARMIVFAAPTWTRVKWIYETVQAIHGYTDMHRIQAMTFDEIRSGRRPEDSHGGIVPAAAPDGVWTRV